MTKDEEEKLRAKVKKAADEGRVTIASTEKLELVYMVADGFVEDCLGFTSFLITDLSKVSDFVEDDKISEVIECAKAMYGVDISDVIDKYIVDIAATIIERSK